MRDRRAVSAILVAGVVAGPPACASLLGVDDASYGGADAAADVTRADEAVAPRGDEADAGGPPPDASVDAPPFCLGIDADLCADFDEGDLTAAYVHGVRANVFGKPQTNGGSIAIGTGPNGSRALVVITEAIDAGNTSVWLPFQTPPKTAIHLEMDVSVSVKPQDIEGALPILFVKPSTTPPCYFTYEYSNAAAHVFRACNGTSGLGPNLDVPLGGPQHLVFDAQIDAGTIQVQFQTGAGPPYTDSESYAGGSDDLQVQLGGNGARAPVPQSSVIIDNVVMTAR